MTGGAGRNDSRQSQACRSVDDVVLQGSNMFIGGVLVNKDAALQDDKTKLFEPTTVRRHFGLAAVGLAF